MKVPAWNGQSYEDEGVGSMVEFDVVEVSSVVVGRAVVVLDADESFCGTS